MLVAESVTDHCKPLFCKYNVVSNAHNANRRMKNTLSLETSVASLTLANLHECTAWHTMSIQSENE